MSEAVKIAGQWIELIGPFDIAADYTLEGEEGPTVDQAQLTPGFVADMSADMKAAFGIETVIEPAGEIPAGSREIGSALVDFNGKPKRELALQVIPIEELRSAKLAQLDVAYNAVMSGGFTHTFGDVVETLQMRDKDQVNWLILKDTCNDARAAGAGGMTCPQKLRVTSNREYALSFDAIHAIVTAAKAWGGKIMSNSWRIKNEIESANDFAAIEAIDVYSVGSLV